MRSSQGFTILELMFAMALSAIIAVALFNTFLSSSRGVALINEKTAYEMMVSTLYHQFEKDIYGACIPVQFLVQLKEEEKKKKEAEKEKTQDTKADQAQQQPADQKKEKEIPPLKKVFFSSSDKGILKQLTFITRNALAFYTDKEQKDVTSLLVRVMYQLKEDPDEPGTYKLLRSQGTQLSPDGYEDEKKVRAYELARGIKKMKATFYKETVKKENGEAQKKDAQQTSGDDQKKSEQKKEFSAFASWSIDTEENGKPLLPWFVEFEITFDRAGIQHVERCMFQVAVADKNDIMASLPKESPVPLATPAAGTGAGAAGGQTVAKVTVQSIPGGQRGQGGQRPGQRQQQPQRKTSQQPQQQPRQQAAQSSGANARQQASGTSIRQQGATRK